MSEEEIDALQMKVCDLECQMFDAKWRHYKGNTYQVVALSLSESTHEILVTYRERGKGHYWTRPLSQWQEMVDCEGTQVPRFQKLENK